MRRNAFGRQVDSFEADLAVAGLDGGRSTPCSSGRRSWSGSGPGVEVLAAVDGQPVLCRQGAVMVAAFHPELSDDLRLHELFLELMPSVDRLLERGTDMSGHSKWATIKHKKGAADKARGKLFAKLIRQVEVAAREGGGDPDMNPTLRTMYQKARDASVPLDTIERAIKRGTGELEGVTYEPITYEGYAPGGVAVLVDVLTDNRNRTGAEIRTAVHEERRLDGRARRGGLAVRAQGRRHRARARSRRTT